MPEIGITRRIGKHRLGRRQAGAYIPREQRNLQRLARRGIGLAAGIEGPPQYLSLDSSPFFHVIGIWLDTYANRLL